MTKQMKCATEIARYIGIKGLHTDTLIYVDGARYYITGEGELIKDIDCYVKDYIKYAGDFLTMSFEGPLYDVFNYDFEFKVYADYERELSDIFKKYGKYYEMGESWNLSLYDL